jgi:hypothetical protein
MELKHCILAAALFTAGMSGTAGANLLQNPGFEEAGTTPESARHWKINDPDDHGDAWGNAIRVDWRSQEGAYIGAIRATWAGMGDFGGFWQEAPAVPGTTYRASAWFWADGRWTAAVQELKIEFWNQDRTAKLSEELIPLHDVGEIWVNKSLVGTAPEEAGWARVVVNVNGTGEHGALQVDAVRLEQAD